MTDSGEVLTHFEELSATLQTKLKRALQPTSAEQQQLCNELKRHRLIRWAANFSMDDEEALLAVLPTILGIISDDMLEAALEFGPSAVAGEKPADLQSSLHHNPLADTLKAAHTEGSVE